MTLKPPEAPNNDAVIRETLAMREIAASLAPLLPDERARVLRWAQRFAAAVTRDCGPDER